MYFHDLLSFIGGSFSRIRIGVFFSSIIECDFLKNILCYKIPNALITVETMSVLIGIIEFSMVYHLSNIFIEF